MTRCRAQLKNGEELGLFPLKALLVGVWDEYRAYRVQSLTGGSTRTVAPWWRIIDEIVKLFRGDCPASPASWRYRHATAVALSLFLRAGAFVL